MHLTLKTGSDEAGRRQRAPAAGALRRFVAPYNHERPHQALEMATAGRVCYARSSALYRGLDELDYPFHDWTSR